MNPLLAVDNLVVRFPVGSVLGHYLKGEPRAIDAVAGVSLTMEPGETVAVVGESGSGKTTLARAIAGLIPAEEGSVRFQGRPIANLGAAARKELHREIAMIFQDPVGSLSPRFSVRGLLAEPFRIHGLAKPDLDAEVTRLLGLVGLPPAVAERHPHQLSGGQARRVGVARAIALSPKLVIADEPTAGLDVSVQGEVLNLLNELRERLGLSMLIITHNLNIVRHVADRMAIMYLGRIVEAGETAAIFANPRHPYSLALLSANPEPDPDARPRRIALEGEVPSLFSRPAGCEFHGRCPFVQERCRKEAPDLTAGPDDRRVACHFPLEPPANG